MVVGFTNDKVALWLIGWGGVSLDGENLVVFYNIKSGLIIALRFTMGFNATFNNISDISW
jgi:hypothetical protein